MSHAQDDYDHLRESADTAATALCEHTHRGWCNPLRCGHPQHRAPEPAEPKVLKSAEPPPPEEVYDKIAKYLFMQGVPRKRSREVSETIVNAVWTTARNA